MEISKSTPYVRYRENISSTLHKGTIHIESEYLDRERKTTIESIEGQTWQNMVNGENKEEEILPRLGLKIEGNEDVLDTVEQHMPIDTIIGDVEPVANEDGTYTYEISTMEGSYAKTLDGENNFSLTSDGLVGDMYIKYNAQGEEVNGNIVMNNQSSYTIENSSIGEIKSAILKGQTLVNIKGEETFEFKFVGRYYNDYILNPVKDNTKYLILYDLTITDTIKIGLLKQTSAKDVVWTDSTEYITSSNGKVILNSGTGGKFIRIISSEDNTHEIKHLTIIEYQQGMENWDIPYFEGMQSVKMPILKTTGKNLLEYIEWEIDKRLLTNGGTDNNTGSNVSNYINVSDLDVITFSGFSKASQCLYDKDKKIIGERVLSSNMTVDVSGADYIRVTINNTKDYSKPQMEVGSVSTSYEPYKSSTLTTPSDLVLRKVGDVQDELDLETGVLTQRIGEDGVVLSQQIIKTVDLTIKDQDNKIIQSLHTHPSTTHINLSSDGLIPSAELSYTMYGNIGETTGEKITDGTDSKLIEGKIYGDTLLNVLPSPSLKNSMDYYTSMQKLNNGYDNINVADGEFKKATLYGQTLVNLLNSTHFVTASCTNPSHNGNGLYTADKGDWFGFGFAVPTTIGQKYIFHIKNAITTNGNIYVRENSLQGNQITSFNTNSVKYVVFTATTDITHFGFGGASLSNPTINTPILMYYQDGIENWNWDGIPYFEGMQSVVMPSVKTYGKNLIDPNKLKLWSVDNMHIEYDGYLPCKPNTYYIPNMEMGIVGYYDKHLNKIGESAMDIVNARMTPENCYFMLLRTWRTINNENVSLEYYKNNFQLEEGQESTSYEPYKSNTLSTPEDVTLRAVGDVRDELDCANGEYVQRINEIVLNGSENWSKYITTEDTISFISSGVEDAINKQHDSTNLMCDKLVVSGYGAWTKANNITLNNKSFSICVLKSSLETEDINGFKKWLAENN